MKFVIKLVRESTDSSLSFTMDISNECPDVVKEIIKYTESVYGFDWVVEYYYVGCPQ